MNISVLPAPAEDFFSSVSEPSLDHLDPNIPEGVNLSDAVIAYLGRYAIPLTICADSNMIAQTDVCLLHRPTMVLLVLIEDMIISNRTDAESQVVGYSSLSILKCVTHIHVESVRAWRIQNTESSL
jgi:hypothetical protein